MSVNVEMDDAANIVANSIMAVEGMLKGKEIVLKQNIGPNLRALQTDSLKVRQILVNLLSNATKFTEKGEILVTVVQKNGMVSFSVKDSGIGIEPKNFSKVFEEFQQIDNSNTRSIREPVSACRSRGALRSSWVVTSQWRVKSAKVRRSRLLSLQCFLKRCVKN